MRTLSHISPPRLDCRDERPYCDATLSCFFRGRDLLDEKVPKWFLRIRLPDFDFVNPTKCILAQLYGTYMKGLRALGILDRSVEYGFDGTCPENVDELHELWTVAVLQRLHSEGRQSEDRQSEDRLHRREQPAPPILEIKPGDMDEVLERKRQVFHNYQLGEPYVVDPPSDRKRPEIQ